MLGDRPEFQTAKAGSSEASGTSEGQDEGQGQGEESGGAGQSKAEGTCASAGGDVVVRAGSGVACDMMNCRGQVSCGLWQAHMLRSTTLLLLLSAGRQR